MFFETVTEAYATVAEDQGKAIKRQDRALNQDLGATRIC